MMVGDILREWRGIRGMSQLALALDADVSARHLSFVESGRSRPSQEMVLRLAEALGLPLRDRNAMLLAAGHAPRYSEGSMDDETMTEVREAIAIILGGHEPHPAIALDAAYNVIAANGGFRSMLGRFGVQPEAPVNLVDMVFSPGPMRAAIVNWPEVAAYMAHRMRQTLRVRGSGSQLRPAFERALAQPGVAEAVAGARSTGGRATLPLSLGLDGTIHSWITTVTTFGAPQDAFVEELTIEQFYPVSGHPIPGRDPSGSAIRR
jgi:transcriptional regulator with XRE-family HTH domain